MAHKGAGVDALGAMTQGLIGSWILQAMGNERPGRQLAAVLRPLEIIEADLIEHLLEESIIVVCAGGGGVPVVRDFTGALRGVEAVIDKDLSAAVLAHRLRVDRLVVLTDVPARHRGLRHRRGAPGRPDHAGSAADP